MNDQKGIKLDFLSPFHLINSTIGVDDRYMIISTNFIFKKDALNFLFHNTLFSIILIFVAISVGIALVVIVIVVSSKHKIETGTETELKVSDTINSTIDTILDFI